MTATEIARDCLEDEDGIMVWCERCQRIHKRITFSNQDYDSVISKNAKTLADAIDADITQRILAGLGIT